jgi:hypothetical protein
VDFGPSSRRKITIGLMIGIIFVFLVKKRALFSAPFWFATMLCTQILTACVKQG